MSCTCPFFTALSPIKSLVHGKGLFTNKYFPTDSFVLTYSDQKGNLNMFSRFINYGARYANVYMKKERDGTVGLYALYNIYPGKEILLNC